MYAFQAAIILIASEPRIAAFLAIILSMFSFVSLIIVLFRLKADMEHPIAYPRGEGLAHLLVCVARVHCFLIADLSLKLKR